MSFEVWEGRKECVPIRSGQAVAADLDPTTGRPAMARIADALDERTL
jgi:hypothetical protein